MVTPMLHARLGETLDTKGAKAARIIKRMEDTMPNSVTAAWFDGIIVARSTFRRAMTHRGVGMRERAKPIGNPAENEQALIALTDRPMPGHWRDVPPVLQKARNTTGMPAASMAAFTMKPPVRQPVDGDPGYVLPTSAGAVALRQTVTCSSADARVTRDIKLARFPGPATESV